MNSEQQKVVDEIDKAVDDIQLKFDGRLVYAVLLGRACRLARGLIAAKFLKLEHATEVFTEVTGMLKLPLARPAIHYAALDADKKPTRLN